MKVVLIRHFKVDHQWKTKGHFRDFFDDIDKYDSQAIINTRELDFPVRQVYISTLSRAAETAKFLKGEKNIIITSLINEVDLRGTSRIWFRMSGLMWYMIAFIKWRMNSGHQNETYRDTVSRAREFLKMIEEKNEDCIVVSHGMFLTELINLMLKQGYCGGKKDYRLRNGEVVEMVK